MVWNFSHTIRKGDIVVANAGFNKINGIGIVTSDYIDPKNPENPGSFDYFWHLRKINWKITEEKKLNQNVFYRKTLAELDETKWNIIKNAYIEKNQEYLDIFNDIECSNKTKGIKDYLQKIGNILSEELFNEEELKKTFISFSAYLKEIADKNFISDFSLNHNIPNMYIRIPHSHFYILYISREDKKGIYLSLNHGIFAMRDKVSYNGSKITLKTQTDIDKFLNRSKNQIEEIREQNKSQENFSSTMELYAKNATSGQLYEGCSIYSKYYSFDNLPSEEELLNDFKEIKKIYFQLINESKFRIIEDKNEISSAQKKLEMLLKNNASEIITPSTTENFIYLSKLKIWASFGNNPNSFYNLFGIGKPLSNVNKTIVEINIPYKGIDKKISGAFVKDPDGNVFLVHRGKLGGKFSGKKLLEDNYEGKWVEVEDGITESKVIPIGNLDDPKFLEKLRDFVFEVCKIKKGDECVNNQNFFEYLSEKGYLFDKKLVENFYFH